MKLFTPFTLFLIFIIIGLLYDNDNDNDNITETNIVRRVGFDPNITGRSRAVSNWDVGLNIKKIVVLSITRESHGNATGIGGADVTTMRLYRDLDVSATYANCITSMSLGGAAIPIIMNTDREAIALAVKSVVRVEPSDCRIVRIKNTLALEEIEVSDSLLEEVGNQSDKMCIVSPPRNFNFSPLGDLIDTRDLIET